MPEFFEGDFGEEAYENSSFVRIPKLLDEKDKFWESIREKARLEGVDFGFGEVAGKMKKHTSGEEWQVPRMRVALIKGGSSAGGFVSYLKEEMLRQVKLLRHD